MQIKKIDFKLQKMKSILLLIKLTVIQNSLKGNLISTQNPIEIQHDQNQSKFQAIRVK